MFKKYQKYWENTKTYEQPPSRLRSFICLDLNIRWRHGKNVGRFGRADNGRLFKAARRNIRSQGDNQQKTDGKGNISAEQMMNGEIVNVVFGLHE